VPRAEIRGLDLKNMPAFMDGDGKINPQSVVRESITEEGRRLRQGSFVALNPYSSAKVPEKLHYMHANPVKAKLVEYPSDWPQISWCYYYRLTRQFVSIT
jgi:hypothetical protein